MIHPTFTRRRALAGAATCLLAAPAAAQPAASLPTDRYAPTYLLKFWRANPPHTTLGLGKGESMPGFAPETPHSHLHQPSSGARIAPSEAQLLRRRLELVHRTLMTQPSLADIHGSSISADINISVEPTAQGLRLITARLSYNLKPINPDNPKTFAIAGRYQTPGGEGAVLRVVLNPYEFVAGRDIYAEGVVGKVMAIYAGTTRGLMVTDAPQPLSWDRNAFAEKLASDRSWYDPAAPGEHPLLVSWSSYRQENLELFAGRLPATAAIARLSAAAYMTDWAELHSRMLAIR